MNTVFFSVLSEKNIKNFKKRAKLKICYPVTYLKSVKKSILVNSFNTYDLLYNYR